MKDTKRGPIIDSIIKYLIIFMILPLSFIVTVSIIKKESDPMSIMVGIVFIFILIFIKWVIKEIET